MSKRGRGTTMFSTPSHFILNRKSRNYIIHVSRKLWLYQEVKRCFLKPKDPFCHIATDLPHTHTSYILLSASKALLPLTALLGKKVWSPNFQSTPAPLNILPFEKLTIPRIGRACFFIGDFFFLIMTTFYDRIRYK